jgi:hypothetical protein
MKLAIDRSVNATPSASGVTCSGPNFLPTQAKARGEPGCYGVRVGVGDPWGVDRATAVAVADSSPSVVVRPVASGAGAIGTVPD